MSAAPWAWARAMARRTALSSPRWSSVSTRRIWLPPQSRMPRSAGDGLEQLAVLVGIVEVVDRHPEVDAPARRGRRGARCARRRCARGSAEAAAKTPTGPGADERAAGRAASPAALDSGEEPRSAICASSVRRHAEDAGAPAEAVGDAGGAEALARIEQRKLSAVMRRPLSGVAISPARAARLALELHGDVDAGAGVEGLGPVGGRRPRGRRGRGGPSGRRACRRRRRCGASGPARGRRSRAGAPGACRRPAAGRKRARSMAVAVVEVAEAEVGVAAAGVDLARPMSTSMTPYSPQTRAAPPSTRSAVFSSMPKPRRTPARSIATTSRPSRPRLMKCWSTMPKGRSRGRCPSAGPALGVVGDAVDDRLDRGAAEDHRLRHHRGPGARPGDEAAGRLRGADGGEERASRRRAARGRRRSSPGRRR